MRSFVVSSVFIAFEFAFGDARVVSTPLEYHCEMYDVVQKRDAKGQSEGMEIRKRPDYSAVFNRNSFRLFLPGSTLPLMFNMSSEEYMFSNLGSVHRLVQSDVLDLMGFPGKGGPEKEAPHLLKLDRETPPDATPGIEQELVEIIPKSKAVDFLTTKTGSAFIEGIAEDEQITVRESFEKEFVAINEIANGRKVFALTSIDNKPKGTLSPRESMGMNYLVCERK